MPNKRRKQSITITPTKKRKREPTWRNGFVGKCPDRCNQIGLKCQRQGDYRRERGNALQFNSFLFTCRGAVHTNDGVVHGFDAVNNTSEPFTTVCILKGREHKSINTLGKMDAKIVMSIPAHRHVSQHAIVKWKVVTQRIQVNAYDQVEDEKLREQNMIVGTRHERSTPSERTLPAPVEGPASCMKA